MAPRKQCHHMIGPKRVSSTLRSTRQDLDSSAAIGCCHVGAAQRNHAVDDTAAAAAAAAAAAGQRLLYLQAAAKSGDRFRRLQQARIA